MYKIDDELSALLIEAHRNIGFLKGLFKYAPNKDVFVKLMLLKECTYSQMVDYDTPAFQGVLVIRGDGKGEIVLENCSKYYGRISICHRIREDDTDDESIIKLLS